MKKLLFSAIALVVFSSVGLAATNVENKLDLKAADSVGETTEIMYVQLADYPMTVCYEVKRVSIVDDSGVIKTTITYRCVTFDV